MNKRPMSIHVAYQINKKNYTHLCKLQNHMKDINHLNKIGGDDPNTNKSKESDKMVTITSTYQLTLGSMADHPDIQIPEPEVIKKLGQFTIESNPVIGDTDYSDIDLEKGTYDAYQIDDNLMIINTKLHIKPDKTINKWTWVHSGQGVGVDSGCFGFYDKSVVEMINDLTSDPKNKSRFASNDLPMVNLDFSKENYTIVDGAKIDVEQTLDKDKLNTIKKLKPFGVMGTTVTGDGGFECYVIGTNRAILIGGITSDKLFAGEEE